MARSRRDNVGLESNRRRFLYWRDNMCRTLSAHDESLSIQLAVVVSDDSAGYAELQRQSPLKRADEPPTARPA
jgi:hypothetical protein